MWRNKKEKRNKQVTWVVILLIIDISLLIFDISWIYYTNTVNQMSFGVRGNLIYLENISHPENKSIGIWIKIILKTPPTTNISKVILEIDSNYEKTYISLSSKLFNGGIYKNGYAIGYVDKDENNLVSSGDLIHIYNKNMNKNKICLYITGYSGGLNCQIP